jgi:hypothetical protein
VGLALLQASPPDPVAAAFAGWHVEVEDDLGGGDSRVTAVSTVGCVTTIMGEKGRWAIDWARVDTVGLADVFVFLRAPELQIAVVADVRDEAGLAKLRGMHTAMIAARERCRPR